jgi:phage/conjugal plasmid C-4 type zinc finger TraR family protein
MSLREGSLQVADEADRGNEVAERNLEMALQAHKTVKREVSDECVECDEPISAARQQATGGTDLCVMCQHRMETQAKHLRKSGW